MKRVVLVCVWMGLQLYAGDSKVWVSFDIDAMDQVRKSMKASELCLDEFRSGDAIAVAQVERSQLPELSRLFHEHFHRCGGYRVHQTAREAHQVNVEFALQQQVSAYGKRVVYSLNNPISANALADAVSEASIFDVIEQLSSFENRFYDSQSGIDAAVWLRAHWDALTQTLPGATSELFSHQGFSQPSVILTIPGSRFPEEVIVLGGHLDSTLRTSGTRSPGADDDASGIASITEVLRAIVETGFVPERTLKFMGYAGEEHGLLGSDEIASQYQNNGVDVIGVLQLDMTNYNGSVNDIYLIDDYTNLAQNTFITQLLDAYLTNLTYGTTRCGYACSDHASWFFAGYPASIPFESRFQDYNHNIHTSADTLAVSGNHALHAKKFSQVAACYVAELAKGPVQNQPEPDQQLVTVGVHTMVELMAAYKSCESGVECVQDLDDSGTVDQLDLLLLVRDWTQATCLGFSTGAACP